MNYTALKLNGIHAPELTGNTIHDDLIMQSIGVAQVARHFDTNVFEAIIPSNQPELVILRSTSYEFKIKDLPVETLKRSEPDKAGVVSIYLYLKK